MTNDTTGEEMPAEKIRVLVANTPVFIPAENLRTWQRAAHAAEDAGMSLVEYATTAMIEKLTHGDEILSVWVDEPEPHEERFAGHWVVEPESTSEAMKGASEPTGPDSWSVGLAETSHGRFVLALAHYRSEFDCEMHVFDTLDALGAAFGEDERVGRHFLELVTERMEQQCADANQVVWRDI